MSLRDGPRQLLAAFLAFLGFLALYLAFNLVWWAALGLSVVIYGAMLLLIPRRPLLAEVMLSEQVTAQDIFHASTALNDAAARLNAAALQAPMADRDDLTAMARHLSSIRALIAADPRDYRTTRQFITYFLPLIVAAVESYVGLAKMAQSGNAEKLAELGQMVKGFGPVIQKIDQACLENDFSTLESEISALQFQLKRV